MEIYQSKRLLSRSAQLTLFFILAFQSFLFAQNKIDEDKVLELAYKLRCPVCQGLSVGESQSEISENMKGKIRELLAEGKTDNQVLDFFVNRYGEWILREPKKEGLDLLIWGLPVVITIISLLIFVLRLYLKKKKTENP